MKPPFDQQPFKITAETLKQPWCGYPDGRCLRCRLCGHFFVVGDIARMIFTNGSKFIRHPGNPFVCVVCDGPDVGERLTQQWEEAHRRFWWMDFEHAPALTAYEKAHGPNPHGHQRHQQPEAADDGARLSSLTGEDFARAARDATAAVKGIATYDQLGPEREDEKTEWARFGQLVLDRLLVAFPAPMSTFALAKQRRFASEACVLALEGWRHVPSTYVEKERALARIAGIRQQLINQPSRQYLLQRIEAYGRAVYYDTSQDEIRFALDELLEALGLGLGPEGRKHHEAMNEPAGLMSSLRSLIDDYERGDLLLTELRGKLHKLLTDAIGTLGRPRCPACDRTANDNPHCSNSFHTD